MALIGQVVSEKKIFEFFFVIYMYIALGWGQTNPWETIFFQNYLPSVHLPISCKICLSNDILTIFPHSNALATYVDLAVK